MTKISSRVTLEPLPLAAGQRRLRAVGRGHSLGLALGLQGVLPHLAAFRCISSLFCSFGAPKRCQKPHCSSSSSPKSSPKRSKEVYRRHLGPFEGGEALASSTSPECLTSMACLKPDSSSSMDRGAAWHRQHSIKVHWLLDFIQADGPLPATF